MSSHTQGPWHYALTVVDNGDEYLAIIGTPNGNEDALPHRGAFIGKITGKRERREANARLIAAAPDLLHQLQSVLDRLEATIERLPDTQENAQWEHETVEIFTEARAVIAKAKGK
jgi:hypothetical protein